MSRLLSSFGLGKSQTSTVVGLGMAGAAWQSSGRDWAFESVAKTQDANDPITSVIQRVQQRLSSVNLQNITWLATPDLLPTWVQTPASGVRNLQELHALTQARAAQLFGLPNAAPWLLSADWHHAQPFLCCATSSSWAQALPGKLTSSLHLLLQEAQPQLQATTWLAITTSTHLNLMYCQNKRWTHLRSLRLPTVVSGEKLVSKVHDEWQRESLKTEHATGQLQWLQAGTVTTTNLPSQIKKLALKSVMAHKTEASFLALVKAPSTELQTLVQEVQFAQMLLRGVP